MLAEKIWTYYTIILLSEIYYFNQLQSSYLKNVRMLLESFVHFVMVVNAVIQTYSREIAPFN